MTTTACRPHFVAQVESLHERRLAEARLANEREFLRITLDSIGDAVITADADGRITYMNDPAVALIGKPFASAEGKYLHDVLHLTQLDTAAAAPDIIERCRREKVFVKHDEACSLRRPDGSTCYVNDAATPVLDANQDLSGFVIVLHDVTASLQRTRELHHRADHDALTGLLNRAAFERSVHAGILATRARRGTSASLVVVDLDRFKSVNDSVGSCGRRRRAQARGGGDAPLRASVGCRWVAWGATSLPCCSMIAIRIAPARSRHGCASAQSAGDELGGRRPMPPGRAWASRTVTADLRIRAIG